MFTALNMSYHVHVHIQLNAVVKKKYMSYSTITLTSENIHVTNTSLIYSTDNTISVKWVNNLREGQNSTINNSFEIMNFLYMYMY